MPPLLLSVSLPLPPTIVMLVPPVDDSVSLPVPPNSVTLLPPLALSRALPLPAWMETFEALPAMRVSLPLPPRSDWNEPLSVTGRPRSPVPNWATPVPRLTMTPVPDGAKLRVLLRLVVEARTTSPAPGLRAKRLLPLPPTRVSPCVAISVVGPLPATSELLPESPTRTDGPAPPMRVSCPVPTAAMRTGTVTALASSLELPCVMATSCVAPVGTSLDVRTFVVPALYTRKGATAVRVSPSSSVTVSVTR